MYITVAAFRFAGAAFDSVVMSSVWRCK